MAEVRIEDLLGRSVADPAGAVIGRIEEIIAEGPDDALRVVEYHVGPYALTERLGLSTLIAPLLRLFGIRFRERIAIPWQEMDLSDSRRPRSLKARQELPKRRMPIA